MTDLYQDLADEINESDKVEAEVANRNRRSNTEVFVKTVHDGRDATSYLDNVIVTAHDYGFVPRGITESGAMRLQPRSKVEL